MIICRLLVTSIFISQLLCLTAFASDIPDEALLILKSRTVIGSVPFSDNSIQINRSGRTSIKNVLPVLSENEKSKIIRLEGFCKGTNDETTTINHSMMLAKTVRDYLAVNGFDNVYITGFGSDDYDTNETIKLNRVDIAIYDKLMDIDSIEITQTIETLIAE